MALSVKAAALVSFCLSALFCGNQLRYSTQYSKVNQQANQHNNGGQTTLRAFIHSMVDAHPNSTSPVDSHRRAAPIGSEGTSHGVLKQNGSLLNSHQVSVVRTTESWRSGEGVVSEKPAFKLVHQGEYDKKNSIRDGKERQESPAKTSNGGAKIQSLPSQILDKEYKKKKESFKEEQKRLSMEYLLDAFPVIPGNVDASGAPLAQHVKSEDVSKKLSVEDTTKTPENEKWKPSEEQAPRIPHIIHQTWDNNQVPDIFSGWMRTWSENHPEWEYWFWTQDDVRLFLSRFYPDFLPEYESYEKDIYRANAMRFYIMYHFGGVYADLDLESLKPMDFWTYTEDCILPEETHAHPIILRQQEKSNAMITLLACRPHHPFFKLAIDMLPMYKDLDYGDKLLYIDKVYQNFTSVSHQQNDTVKLVHPDYFLPTYDQGWTARIRAICQNRDSLLTPERKVCDTLKKTDFKNAPKSYSYTNHHWIHVVMLSEAWKKKDTRSVSSIVSNAKDLQSFLRKL